MSDEINESGNESGESSENLASESSGQEELESQSNEGEEVVQAETAEELEEEIEEAIKEGASEKEIKNMIKEFKLKVNGRDIVRKIDLSNDEDIKKELQLAAAGRLAMQESAQLKKLYNQEIERLRSNPSSVLRDLGISEDDLMDMYAKEINEFVSKKQRPQEEIQAEERQKEFEQLKREKEELENKIKEEARSRELQKLEKEFETDIISALDSDPDLPATPEVVDMVIDEIIWATKNGFQNVTAKDVLPTVKEELQSKFRKIASSLKSPAALKAILGDDVLNKLREERMEQAKKITSVKELKKPISENKQADVSRKKVKLSDLMRS